MKAKRTPYRPTSRDLVGLPTPKQIRSARAGMVRALNSIGDLEATIKGLPWNDRARRYWNKLFDDTAKTRARWEEILGTEIPSATKKKR